MGLAGNVGYSLAEQVIEEQLDYYVVELSSFQLDDTHDFRPWVAVLLNITPDHLDRYGYSLEQYAQAKLRIARNLDSSCYFHLQRRRREYPAATSSRRFWTARQLPFSLHHRPDVHLAGYYTPKTCSAPTCCPATTTRSGGSEHCRSRRSSASTTARTCWPPCWPPAWPASPSRLKPPWPPSTTPTTACSPWAKSTASRYINDSKATNVEAAWYALDGIQQPSVWIAGGTDKGNDYSSLLRLAEHRVKALDLPGRRQCQAARRFRRRRAAHGGNPEHGRRRGAAPPPWPPPATWCCSRPAAPASTCSKTTRTAAGNSRQRCSEW